MGSNNGSTRHTVTSQWNAGLVIKGDNSIMTLIMLSFIVMSLFKKSYVQVVSKQLNGSYFDGAFGKTVTL